jgi:hypothetical protein
MIKRTGAADFRTSMTSSFRMLASAAHASGRSAKVIKQIDWLVLLHDAEAGE